MSPTPTSSPRKPSLVQKTGFHHGTRVKSVHGSGRGYQVRKSLGLRFERRQVRDVAVALAKALGVLPRSEVLGFFAKWTSMKRNLAARSQRCPKLAVRRQRLESDDGPKRPLATRGPLEVARLCRIFSFGLVSDCPLFQETLLDPYFARVSVWANQLFPNWVTQMVLQRRMFQCLRLDQRNVQRSRPAS